MTDVTKSDDQIARDKEAVARMIGAKTAMEAAQRRIELLESRMKLVQDRCRDVGKALGNTYFNLFTMDTAGGAYKVRPSQDIFDDIDKLIRSAL